MEVSSLSDELKDAVSPLERQLLDLGVPKESVRKVMAIINAVALEKFEKWKRNWKRTHEKSFER